MRLFALALLLVPGLWSPIVGAEPVAIEAIHGQTRASELVGETVSVEGVVTLVQRDQFWMQEPWQAPDSFARQGLWVSSPGSPSVERGDRIRVSGVISAWQRPGRDDDLLITRLDAAAIEPLSKGHPLPEPLAIGRGATPIPRSLAPEDMSLALRPEEYALDFWTSLLGMRVRLTENHVVEPTNRFLDTWVVADRTHRHVNDQGVMVTRPDDENFDRVLVQSNEFLKPDFPDPANISDRFANVTGVVHYDHGNFRIVAEHALRRIAVTRPEPGSELRRSPEHLLIASYNVENLNPIIESPARVASLRNIDDAIGTGRMDALGHQIVAQLNSPDVIGLQEIQDNDGAEQTEVVSAELTLSALTDAILRAGGPQYHWIDDPPASSGATGGQPGGNIRNAWLYNPARVRLVEDSVRAINDSAFAGSRPPSVAEFEFNGHVLTLINNHWSSKWGSSPTFGRQPRQVAAEDERLAQAEALRQAAEQLMAQDARLVILGDFNDHWFSPAMRVLTELAQPRLYNLVESLPEARRWTKVFEGNGQAIDHMLVNEPLQAIAEFEIVHLNEAYARQAADHEPLLGRFYLP
jgi:predicted extracellular nuclease